MNSFQIHLFLWCDLQCTWSCSFSPRGLKFMKFFTHHSSLDNYFSICKFTKFEKNVSSIFTSSLPIAIVICQHNLSCLIFYIGFYRLLIISMCIFMTLSIENVVICIQYFLFTVLKRYSYLIHLWHINAIFHKCLVGTGPTSGTHIFVSWRAK